MSANGVISISRPGSSCTCSGGLITGNFERGSWRCDIVYAAFYTVVDLRKARLVGVFAYEEALNSLSGVEGFFMS